MSVFCAISYKWLIEPKRYKQITTLGYDAALLVVELTWCRNN